MARRGTSRVSSVQDANRMSKDAARKATQGLANYIIKQRADSQRVLRLPMIPARCHRNLLILPHCAWQAMASRHMCLSHFVRLRSCPFAVRKLHCIAGIEYHSQP